MNLYKTLLLALLLLSAASWAMEFDGFEPWKEDTMQAESSAATAPVAPKIYQRLQQFAAKELKLKYQLPKIRVGQYHGSFAVAAWYNCAGWYDDQNETGTWINKEREDLFPRKFSMKKGLMIHETDHAKRLHTIIGCLWWAFAPRSLERLADEASIKHCGCHKCAKEIARDRRNIAQEVLEQGYLSETQMLKLAKKTIPADAICPFHKELKKRIADKHWGNRKRIADELEQEVADGKLEV